MTIKVQKIREEVARIQLYSQSEVLKDILDYIDKVQKEPVSEGLGEYISELSKQFPEVSFAKLSRIAVRVANWQKQQDQSIIELAEDHAMLAGMEKMKEQMMANGVDGVVHHFEKCEVASVHYNDPTGVPMSYFMSSKGFLAGDKVKVIVIKED